MQLESPTAYPTLYRTYTRRTGDRRENYTDVVERTTKGIAKVGKFEVDEYELVRRMMEELKCLPSGRWMWVGGTEWIEKPENFYSAYNCNSTNINDLESFGLMMALGMMGCGTGGVLEEKYISQLPPVCNSLQVRVIGEPGTSKARHDETFVEANETLGQLEIEVIVGDSRQGWVDSMIAVMQCAFKDFGKPTPTFITVDLSAVRPDGTPIKGFGGVANPIKLSQMYQRIATVLNRYVGKQLDYEGVCLLLDEVALTIVAGNVRRYAGMRQFDSSTPLLKENLWVQDTDGNWKIDPERDALRMSNHTRVYHSKPSLEECIEAVRSQYHSGEGAIQWAGEAVARSNADLLQNGVGKTIFANLYNNSVDKAKEFLYELATQKKLPITNDELEHRMERYGLNPCGEIVGSNLLCDLSEIHLNQLDPLDLDSQRLAFEAGALSVAALLHHEFVDERYRRSRELDPIVGVSFTGLFDFFVQAFGSGWLRWWEEGRRDDWDGLRRDELEPIFQIATALGIDDGDDEIWDDCDAALLLELEQRYLQYWQSCVREKLYEYCDKHGLKCPNRYTTVQPAGSKSLLTGASPGWHPPKAQRYIRRITFTAHDPVALACVDYGYTILPSQSCKDENGKLLDDPYDPRVAEWLVEIPVEVAWANLSGADEIDISQFSAEAQFNFYMQVQKYYTLHNTSATIELREGEIETVGKLIHDAIQNDEGYISCALLARFDASETFPRLPFEPINKENYDDLQQQVLSRRKSDDFQSLLEVYDKGWNKDQGVVGCDSDKCMIPEVN